MAAVLVTAGEVFTGATVIYGERVVSAEQQVTLAAGT